MTSKARTEEVCINGVDMEVTFYYTPEEPAQLYGPPENCSPGEPEKVEIEKVTINSVDFIDLLNTYAFDLIERKILENEK